jgi:hypothetical protein
MRKRSEPVAIYGLPVGALIDTLINRSLVNVNGSIRIDPTFVNHTMTDIMGCINKIENGLTSK